MPIAPDPVDTIERFAELSAILDDPHALRAALLSGIGLDEQAWRAIEQLWMARIREPGGQALADKLGAVYAETLHTLSAALGPPAAPVEPPSPPSSTLRSPVPPAPGAAPHPLACTVDPDVRALRPALPFQRVPEGGAVLPPASPRRARSALADTLECPQGMPVPPALPFGQV